LSKNQTFQIPILTKELPMEEEKKESNQMKNPIDKDKVAENPHILPYAHHIGSSVIKPIDKGRVKGLAVAAMYEQTEMQLEQLRKQVELLAQQAKAIHDRVEISEKIYQADIGFKALIGHVYHLYEKKDGKNLVSMIDPGEWGTNMPYEFVASIRLLSDHTWEIIELD